MKAAEELDSLVDELADPDARREGAARLAAALGCDAVLLLVFDGEVSAFMPAVGMPKTLRGGPLWRAFLSKCARPGLHRGAVDLPPTTNRPAWGASTGSALAVAIGGDPDASSLELLARRMRLLGALLSSQQARRQQDADLELARASGARAHSLMLALEAARSQAADLNVMLTDESRRKDEFLAMLAHELRNPLAPLVNSVELLRRVSARADPSLLRRTVDVMSRQLSHMGRLVDDLLDVSRVSRGAIELKREVLDLVEVLGLAIETASPSIEAKRHRLNVRTPERPVYVEGDRARLVQVFANLLNNASKFTPADGLLTLECSASPGRAKVAVRDNGLGIPADMLDSIFELFSQAHSTLARSEGGLGIGLTLARTLVGLHGGAIEALSDGLGAGSSFVVTLPAARRTGERAPPVVEAAQPAPTPGARVLVVEDNPDSAATMAELLRLMEAEVRVANDGEQALTALGAFAPQLVLLDIGLPGMSGYEVAVRMRAKVGRGARLVALTGYGSLEDQERARAAGCDEHLVKPVSAEALRGLLAVAAAAH